MERSIKELCSEVLNQLKQAGYTEKGIIKHARTYVGSNGVLEAVSRV